MPSHKTILNRFVRQSPQNDGQRQLHKKSGFTLAEVLITLGIIGVVAAMTMPILIGNYQDRKLIALAKKSASTLVNAVNLLQAEYEVTDNEELSKMFTDSAGLGNALSKHLNVVKRCAPSKTGCYDALIKPAKPIDRDGSGTAGYWSGTSLCYLGPTYVLADGSVIAVTKYETCKRTFSGAVTDENGDYVLDAEGNPVKEERPASSCFDLTVDTNGMAPPNQIGKDVFGLFMDSKGPGGNRGDLWNILYADEIKNVVNYNIGDPINR